MGKSKYSHAEAFALMRYRDEQGRTETIWNSRDGVTPFCVRSRHGTEARHVDWHADRCVPDYTPLVGDRVFVDLTIVRARFFRQHYVEEWWDSDMQERYGSKESAIEELAQGDLTYPCAGQPDLIVVTEEWLAKLEEARRG